MCACATKEDVAKFVKSAIGKYWELSIEQITSETNFKDLNASSLERIELQMQIENDFNFDCFTKEEEKSINSVGDLISVLWKRVQDGTATCPKISEN